MAKRFKKDEKDLQDFWENSSPAMFQVVCDRDISAGDVSAGASINPDIGECNRPELESWRVRKVR